MVLVELFTSQGCDMCPEAERVLGAIAARSPRVVPIALHVDYFNDPWKDPFSDKLHSERQAAYNALYTKPKNPEYGLYYTPMVMVDGVQSVNGRDLEGIQAAVRQAQARKPQVSLDATLELKDDRSSGDLRISLAPRSSRDQRARGPGLCGPHRRQGRHRGRIGGKRQQDLDGPIPGAVDSIRVHQAGWLERSLSFSFRLDPLVEPPRSSGLRSSPRTGSRARCISRPWSPGRPERPDREQEQARRRQTMRPWGPWSRGRPTGETEWARRPPR